MPIYSKETGWNEFLHLCHQAESIDMLDKLLRLHLTAEEQEALATRYLIVRELLKGDQTQRDMSKSLQVSIAKITRGSNLLKTIGADIKALLTLNTEKENVSSSQ